MQAVQTQRPADETSRAGASRLLILSYLFPPAGGVGVQRALSLAKYLPESGLQVDVLRARNAAAPVYDPGLLEQIPPGVRIHSAFTPELPFAFRQKVWKWFTGGKAAKTAPDASAAAIAQRRPLWKRLPADAVRRILCPEPEILWTPFAVRAAREIIRKHAIDSLLVTVPPFSALKVASILKREFPHLKLIADFRDDWLRFYLKEFDYQNGGHTARVAARIEREAVEAADIVLVVTRGMLRDMRERYPDVDSNKFALIPNGYDPAKVQAVRPVQRAGGGIVVSYVGTVYSASSARYYLDALDSLPSSVRDAVETRFVGRIVEAEEGYLAGRQARIRRFGFVPQSEALTHMAEADFLLLTMTDDASLTGKLFEYIATGKPVIAVARPESEVARILQETGAGWCAAPEDRAGLRQLLLDAFTRHRAGPNGFHPNREAIRKYERPRLAAELGRLIRNL